MLSRLLLPALVLVGAGALASRAIDRDDNTCSVATDGLDPHARMLVTRHLLACQDYEAGRISKQQYQDTIATIDLELAKQKLVTRERVVWATSVLGVSTQYSESSWSAQQALGRPNVFPKFGDIQQAWASQSADEHAEWIELGYDTPRQVSAVEIYETYNPGAIDKVELITTSGRRIQLRPESEDANSEAPPPQQGANKLVIETPCTSEPIAAVRIDVASTRVEGWNEIDAVGLVPCGL